MLTVLEVEKAVPANLKKAVTQELVDHINSVVDDPIVAQAVRDNFISYSTVLKEGKFKTSDYLNAVVFVSFRLMNLSNKDAYIRTFPKRYAELLAKGTSDKDISSYVSMYSKGTLVNLILQQSMVPSWVLNQDLYQKALNVQADLMVSATSEMVRTTAAKSIIDALAKPKEAAATINLNAGEASGMNELKSILLQLAEKQAGVITSGTPLKTVAAQKIIDVEADE